MTELKSVLTHREEVAQGTMAFYFSRPSGFEFQSGQSIDLMLIDPPETDLEGDSRVFSIASAPGDPHLMVATRMRDTAFKRCLRSLPLGTEVSIDGPYGTFTLHEDAARPAVFLAGGIGITPFFSIAQHAAQARLSHPVYLFYSNRMPEAAAFLEPLQKLAQQNPNFHFVPSMSEMEKSKHPWNGEKGFIDHTMITRHLGSLQGPMYYMAGPPAMVTAMRQILTNAGVNDENIRTEQFSGY